ncbi:MAG: T9SS type A sorting domain-containing protein [Candidatus Kapabacteria bacterium]|nr:T9SS type A sorting domain-containing protein [Candidatus Kapabacteria bacterium]
MNTSLFFVVVSAFFMTPVLLVAQKIAAGGRHSLAICADSTVQSWGYNGFGQLGNGNILEQHTATQVPGLTKIIQVAGGLFHSLFVKSDSTVWACGRNSLGSLGDGSNTNKQSPVQVRGLSGIVRAAGGGEHSLFLNSDGTVWACGANSAGQLGDGTTAHKNIPVKVKGITGVIQVAAGAEFSLFLKNDGTVWACGHNGFGQFGNGSTTSSNVPIQVGVLSGIIHISAGEWHSLFVKNDGTVYSSGRNQYGQLGDGSITNKNTASQVTALSGVTMAEAGGIHSVFVKNDGTVWSCGLNSGGNNDGQLGDGTATDRHTPVQVVSTWASARIIHAEATREHSLFLTEDGILWASGRNNYGQLGNGTFSSVNSTRPVVSNSVCSLLSTSVHIHDESENEVVIYPNPFSVQTKIHINVRMQNITVHIYNVNGQLFRQITPLSGETIILHRGNLPSGLYHVHVSSNNRFITYNKLIITD